MFSVKNDVNETYTYIAIPLPVQQHDQQQHQNVLLDRNVLLKTLSNGTTYVIDTNQFLPNPNANQGAIDSQVNTNETLKNDGVTTISAFKEIQLPSNGIVKSVSILKKPGRPKKGEENPLNSTSKSVLIRSKAHKCNSCSLSFNLLSNYTLHKATHDPSNSKCPECNKTFARHASLKAHVALHMKEETVTCEKCEKEFETELELHNHLKKHTLNEAKNTPDMVCRYCQKEFQDNAEYKKHIAQHNKMRNVLTSRYSRKNKKSEKSLKHHCKVCKKPFQKLSQLERHMRTHSGEKPFVCTVCNKGFTQKCSLQIHMTRHTGVKPYKCSLCPATCSQRGNLKAHILKTHSVSGPDENVFRCNECACVFKKLGTLNGHIRRNHPKQAIVSGDLETVMSQLKELEKQIDVDKDVLHQAITNSGLSGTTPASNANKESLATSGSTLDTSIKQQESKEAGETEPYATYVTLADTNLDGNIKRLIVKQRKVGDVRWHMCMYCVKEFKKPSDLVRHLRVHTRERPYTCKQCYRSFAVKSTLTTHIKTHNGTKDFKCVICSKAFTNTRTLNSHMRSHTVYKPINCTICQKQFQNSVLLKSHLQTHVALDDKKSEGDSSVINIIEQNQEQRLELMQQPVVVTAKGLMSIGVPLKKRPVFEFHSKSRPHKCAKCTAAYRKMSHLKHHILTVHSGIKKYKCEKCLKNFTSQSLLNSHKKVHADVKSVFQCIQCKRTFSSSASLKRHNVLKHSVTAPYLCPYCYKCFKSVFVCRKHIKTHQNDSQVEVINEKTLEEMEKETVAEISASTTLHYQPDLMDTITDEQFNIVSVNNGNIVQQENVDPNLLVQGNILVTDNIVRSSNDNVLNNDAENTDNIQQIAETINDQLFMENLNAVDLMEAEKNMTNICTTDELVNTLEGTDDVLDKQIIENNRNLQLSYHQIYVGLQPNECSQLLDSNFESNLLKFQHDSMLLEDENILQDNANLLPNLTNDIHQQLIIMPQDIVDAPIGLQTETPQYALDPSLTLIPSASNIAAENNVHSSINNFGLAANSTNTKEILSGLRSNQNQKTLTSYTCPICKTNFKSNQALKSHQCFNISVANINDIKNDLMNNIITEKDVPNEVQNDEWIDAELLLSRVQSTVANKIPQDININATDISTNTACVNASNSNAKGKQQCNYCEKCFKKPSDLKRHIRTHTGEKPFDCVECGKRFSLKSTLDSHAKLHLGKKDVVCTVCDSFFTTKSSLKVHMRLHTGARPYKCHFCDMYFRTISHRKSHTLSHFRDASLTGKHPKDVIPKQTKLKMLMDSTEKIDCGVLIPQEHIEIPKEAIIQSQEQIDPIILDQLQNNQFLLEDNITDLSNTYLQFDLVPTKEDLAAEVAYTALPVEEEDSNKFLNCFKETIPITALLSDKNQTDLLQEQQSLQQFNLKDDIPAAVQSVEAALFNCDVCNKCFTRKGVLQRHKKIHSSEQDLHCTICNKGFNNRESYDIHLKIHAGQRPYKCDYCCNSFSDKGHLKTHLKRIHGIVCAEFATMVAVDDGLL